MPPFKVEDKTTIAPLYDGWEETMIWSCLQDCMGVAYADDLRHPASAQIIIGVFCFFAGRVNRALIQNHCGYTFDMVPQNEAWARGIEQVYGEGVNRRLRYATKKEGDVFDRAHLRAIVAALPPRYTLRAIDGPLYRQLMAAPWSKDLCGNFEDEQDFLKNGLGVVALKAGEIVSGASSYTCYRQGIEVEIDTREDHRRRGLALACGAQLILTCLDRGLYPSWDAHNPGSLALSEKLGYHFDRAYPTYAFVTPE